MSNIVNKSQNEEYDEEFEKAEHYELQYEKQIQVIADIKQYCYQNSLQICENLDIEMLEYFLSYINNINQ